MNLESLKRMISTYPDGMRFGLRVGRSRYSRRICLLLVPEFGLNTAPIYVPRRPAYMPEDAEKEQQMCRRRIPEHFKMLKALGVHWIQGEGNKP